MLSKGNAVGFEAWVESKEDKVRLNEYQIIHHPVQGGQSAYTECFLETIDEPFRIKLARLPVAKENRDIKLALYLDGDLIDKKPLRRQSNHSRSWENILQEREGKYIQSSLIFAALATTDDVTKVTISPETMKNLGMIELVLEVGLYEFSRFRSQNVRTLETKGTADEKAKKFSYAVTATDDKICDLRERRTYPFTPAKKGSNFYRFVFKYRPRPILVHLGVIDEPVKPPAPPPVNLKRKRSTIVGDRVPRPNAQTIGGAQEHDVKPHLRDEHFQYLEDRIRRLTARLLSVRNVDGDRADEVVDLTNGSDGE